MTNRPPTPPTQAVDAKRLRTIFRDGKYYQRAMAGEIHQRIGAEHDAHPSSGQPPGTKSQIVYYETPIGKRIAMVHQFILPNGRIGASGLPDPKWIFDGGVLYTIAKSPKM